MDNYQNRAYKSLSVKLKKREIDLINLIQKDFKKDFSGNILDIGSGNGNLIIALSKRFPKAQLLGIDIHKSSIDLANKKATRLKNCKFLCSSLQKFKKGRFDIVISAGVLSMFDDFRKPLRKILNFFKNKKSRGFIFGRFNTSDVDLRVKFRNNKINSEWRDGYNTYSVKTFYRFLKTKYRISFKKFKIDKSLKRNIKDPIRTYTLNLKKNKKILLNDANLITEFYFLKIKKK